MPLSSVMSSRSSRDDSAPPSAITGMNDEATDSDGPTERVTSSPRRSF